MILLTPNKPKAMYMEWTCDKCGLLRTNRATHKHGVPLSRDVLNAIRKRENDLRAEAAKRQKDGKVGS